MFYYTTDKIKSKNRGNKPIDEDIIVRVLGRNTDNTLTVEDVVTGRFIEVDRNDFTLSTIGVSKTDNLNEMRYEGRYIRYGRDKKLFGVVFLLSIFATAIFGLLSTTSLVDKGTSTSVIGMLGLILVYSLVRFIGARKRFKKLTAPDTDSNQEGSI